MTYGKKKRRCYWKKKSGEEVKQSNEAANDVKESKNEVGQDVHDDSQNVPTMNMNRPPKVSQVPTRRSQRLQGKNVCPQVFGNDGVEMVLEPWVEVHHNLSKLFCSNICILFLIY